VKIRNGVKPPLKDNRISGVGSRVEQKIVRVCVSRLPSPGRHEQTPAFERLAVYDKTRWLEVFHTFALYTLAVMETQTQLQNT
jgi:hypothetical protein